MLAHTGIHTWNALYYMENITKKEPYWQWYSEWMNEWFVQWIWYAILELTELEKSLPSVIKKNNYFKR